MRGLSKNRAAIKHIILCNKHSHRSFANALKQSLLLLIETERQTSRDVQKFFFPRDYREKAIF